MSILNGLLTVSCILFVIILAKYRRQPKTSRHHISVKIMVWIPTFYAIIGYTLLFMENRMTLVQLGIHFGRLFALQLFVIYIVNTLYNQVGSILWSTVMLLISISLVTLTRINVATGNRQFYFILLGVVISLILSLVGYYIDILYRLKWLYVVLSILVFATVFFIGLEKNGANNWITLGPIVLQPSEFVKIFYVLFLASLKPRSGKDFWLLSFFTMILMGISVLQVDLGTALILFGIYFVFVFLLTSDLRINLMLLSVGIMATIFAFYRFSHVRTRFISFLDPFSYIDTKGYQITQSLFSIASGKWFGTGLGQGMPEKIPVVYTDFIYAAILEEHGAIMGIALLLIYLFLAAYLVNVSLKLKDTPHILYIVAISSLMLFQTFLIVGGVIKMLPLTGVTLPLISGGGSSVISFLLQFGLVQSILMKNESEVIK